MSPWLRMLAATLGLLATDGSYRLDPGLTGISVQLDLEPGWQCRGAEEDLLAFRRRLLLAWTPRWAKSQGRSKDVPGIQLEPGPATATFEVCPPQTVPPHSQPCSGASGVTITASSGLKVADQAALEAVLGSGRHPVLQSCGSVRQRVEITFSAQGPDEKTVVRESEEALGAEDMILRVLAANALGAILRSPHRLVERLEQVAASDPDPLVRDSAKRAVQEVRGR